MTFLSTRCQAEVRLSARSPLEFIRSVIPETQKKCETKSDRRQREEGAQAERERGNTAPRTERQVKTRQKGKTGEGAGRDRGEEGGDGETSVLCQRQVTG